MKDDKQDALDESIRRLPGEIRQFVEKRIELMMLELSKEFSSIIAQSVYKTIGVLLIALALILLTFAISIYVGGLLHNLSLGYLITSLPILFIGLLLMGRRPRFLLNKIRKQIYGSMMKSVSNLTSDKDSKHKESIK